MSWNNFSDNLQYVDPKLALIIFLSYALIDALYAQYTLSVVGSKPFTAATIGALMYFLIAIGVINYVQNPLYLVPLAVGSWLGTFIVVWRRKNSILRDKH